MTIVDFLNAHFWQLWWLVVFYILAIWEKK